MLLKAPGSPRQVVVAHAHDIPLFDSGIVRILLPVAAKIALATAGRIGGSAGSPRPVTGLSLARKCTSITGGACAMRTGWKSWKLLWTTRPFSIVISYDIS